MGLVDLKRTKADKKAETTGASPVADDYSYGLQLNLDRKELDKLGIKTMPEVGDEYHIHAIGKVTSVNQSAREDNEYRSVGVQLTMADFVHEDDADEATEKETPATEEKEEKVRGAKSVLTNSYRGK